MLITISIIVIIAGITIPLFVTSRASARRTDATNAVMAAFAAAREAAVERRTIVAIEFVSDTTSTDRGDMMVIVDKSLGLSTNRRIGPAIPLPDFVKFDTASPEWTLQNGWDGDADDSLDTFSLSANSSYPYPDIAYMPDGTLADPEGTTDIALIDVHETARDVLRVLPSTGLVIRARHLQDPSQPEGPTNPRTNGRGDNWL